MQGEPFFVAKERFPLHPFQESHRGKWMGERGGSLGNGGERELGETEVEEAIL